MHSKPLGRHVPDRSCGGDVPFLEGVLETPMDDSLGTHALSTAHRGAFDPDGPESGPGRGIQDPESCDTCSENQKIDGLFAGSGHE